MVGLVAILTCIATNFLKKFPLGKVPAFEASDRTCIFESNAIAYYVANEQLTVSNIKGACNIKDAAICGHLRQTSCFFPENKPWATFKL